MALPLTDLPKGGNTPWPPKEVQASYVTYGEHSAWYGGQPQELTRFYAGYAGQDRTGFFDPATTAQPFSSVWRRWFFWARQQPGQITRGRYHIPIAADMSATSADQLFSDEPNLLIPEAHLPKAKSGAKQIQTRLDQIIDESGILTKFHEAAEVSSALGGVFLQAHWDQEIKKMPMLQVIHPDSAIPAFQWGDLSEVIFWRFVEDDGRNVWRHLELHQPGRIVHGLYKGDPQHLGVRAKLTDMAATSIFATVADPTGVISTGLPGLDCVYVPNMRPNRRPRGSDLGRSDYQNVESLMDALDETGTSWMRDIRLGKSRIFAPEEFVQSQGKGKGANFDVEREVYELLKMTPQGAQAVITPNQFAIRVKEHSDTCDALIERIVATAGYSGSTFGLRGAATVERTATEVEAREHRTLVTRGKKIRYWSRAISDILEVMLQVDKLVFNPKGPGSLRPRADFPQTIHDSTKDTAQAILFLDQARAISDQTKIEMAHPDWDPDEVQGELTRILAERAAQALVPTISSSTSNPPGMPVAPGQSPPPAQRPESPAPLPPGTSGTVTPPVATPNAY